MWAKTDGKPIKACRTNFVIRERAMQRIFYCEERIRQAKYAQTFRTILHSIPALGHVRHFSELLFESAHQPVKQAIQKSNFKDAHFQAVLQSLASDWRNRMSTLINCITKGDEGQQVFIQNFAKLLLGNDEALTRSSSDTSCRLQAAVRRVLVRPVLDAAGKKQAEAAPADHSEGWTAMNKLESSEHPEMEELCEFIKEWLSLDEKCEISFFKNSCCRNERGVNYSWNAIEKGSVVQALVRFATHDALLDQWDNCIALTEIGTYSVQFLLLRLYSRYKRSLISKEGILNIRVAR